jgi:pilus assembly protein Flp/PilA
MDTLRRMATLLRDFRREEAGQDLIEYALMAGLVAVAAGSLMPPVASSVGQIYSKAISVLEKFS